MERLSRIFLAFLSLRKNLFFFKQLIEIAEIRWVPLLLNPQISNVQSLKKDVQIDIYAGKPASKETVRTDLTITAGRGKKTSAGKWKLGIKLNLTLVLSVIFSRAYSLFILFSFINYIHTMD